MSGMVLVRWLQWRAEVNRCNGCLEAADQLDALALAVLQDQRTRGADSARRRAS